MLEKHSAQDGVGITLIARRNCALSPRQLGRVFLMIAALSLMIAIGCALMGAWVVLPWSVVEVCAVGVAFLVWGRHANDREHITVLRERLVVEVVCATKVWRHEFNSQWVQLTGEPGRFRRRVLLRCQGREVEIGRHLDDPGRQSLVRELRAALAAVAAAADGNRF